MAEEVEKPAPLPLMDKDKEDSAAALEQEFTSKTRRGAAGSSMDDDDDVDKLMKQRKKKVDDDGRRRSSLVAKVRMLLMAALLPPLMPVKEVCHWSLYNSLHMAIWSSVNASRIFKRRLESLPPPEAAVARVFPTASLWCSAAGVAAAALALLLGAGGRRRRGSLALAYVALAATTFNHCLCARMLGLVLVDDTHVHGPLAFCTALVVFFAARDLAGFRSLRKAAAAAAEDVDDHVAQPGAVKKKD